MAVFEFGSALARLTPELRAFLQSWAAGKGTSALAAVFSTPRSTLGPLEGNAPLAKALADYVDALGFGQPHHVLLTGRSARVALEADGLLGAVPGLAQAMALQHVRACFAFDAAASEGFFRSPTSDGPTMMTGIVLQAERERRLLNDDELKRVFALAPSATHADVRRWLYLVQGNTLLRLLKADLLAAIDLEGRPDCPLVYEGAAPIGDIVAAIDAAYTGGRVPAIVLRPFDLDWEALRLAVRGRPALFVVHRSVQLAHTAAYMAAIETLLEAGHAVFCAAAHPSAQVRAQPFVRDWIAASGYGGFAPVYLEAVPLERDRTNRAVELFESFARAEAAGDPGAERLATWCFRFGLALADELENQRLGPSRALALANSIAQGAWTSPHKGVAPPEAAADLSFPDHVGAVYACHRPSRATRVAPSAGPLRLAHVVPQIVDGGHAPSRLLRTLIEHHDRKRFAPSIFVTERLVMRQNEYPMPPHSSAKSAERGAETLRGFEREGIRVDIDDAVLGFEASGMRIAEKLAAAEIDVAVFHGPDFINMVAAQRTDAPVRVLFEHGTLPNHAGFELVIASTEDSVVLKRAFFKDLGAELVAHPFYVNCRENWKAEPYPLSAFGVPDDALIMTTVTNHLESRCSDDMAWAIAEILRRNPRAWYLPMGNISNAKAITARLDRHGAPDRIRFLGPSNEPSQLARSMKLFLNEFPFGSCLGMLDAMASGCVPVSMYDPSGPVQARYGGMFMGMDRVVTSLRKEDYVDLACRLLADDVMYAEWSTIARASYEARTDLAGYVRRFEDAVQEVVAARR